MEHEKSERSASTAVGVLGGVVFLQLSGMERTESCALGGVL
jgi:hypothetical protein